MASNNKLNSDTISDITAREKQITGQDDPVKGGPTAQAQKHANQTVNPDAVSDITQGERKITGAEAPLQGGPAAMAQSMATQQAQAAGNSDGAHASGKLDSKTISHITAAEKELTGHDRPVKGGPTAQAQKHAKEPITSEALHDITEGEKKSELAKSRQ
ncbi:hypothetical protein PG988_010517 [Apiospora saccharicola]